MEQANFPPEKRDAKKLNELYEIVDRDLAKRYGVTIETLEVGEPSGKESQDFQTGEPVITAIAASAE